MNNQNAMASQQPPSHRPPFPHQGSSYRSDYGPQNGRPSPVNTHSPQMMTYGSPSPQYSPPYIQPPAAKRPRLSEGPNQAFSPPHYPQSPIGQSRSPVGGQPPNGVFPTGPRPGSMPPPQRPADRAKDDDNYGDVLTGTGVNVEEEERNLSRPDYYSHNSFQNQYPNRPGAFDYHNNPQMATNGILHQSQDSQQHQSIPEPSPEERQQRTEARADWEAARFSQNPLWDMFLYGGNLNDRIRKISNRERLLDPQSGVLINTQKTGPPPVARVNGLEGATRVIDRGQAILDSENKGQRLSEIMKLVCLATKTRLTGLMNASARLSIERRQHSKGVVPAEWEDVAVVPRANSEAVETGADPATTPSLKRTFSQANDEPSAGSRQGVVAPVAAIMQKLLKADRDAEAARRAKRAKRNAVNNPKETAAASADAAAEAEVLAVAQEAERKTTKKEQKRINEAENEAQQRNLANQASRMALGGIMGKKRKTMNWLTGSASGTSTPTKTIASTSATTSAAATPAKEKPRPTIKEKQFGIWDEDKDPGIQLRDLLPVLESDGMAPRAYVKGYEILDR